MTKQIYNWVKKAKKDFIKNPGRILEIGSKNINGSVRELFFDAKEYSGIDSEPGFNVDLVLDAHDTTKKFKSSSFDIVLCLEMLEHDNAFWITVEAMKKVLKKGGVLIISTPTFGFPLHRHPKDYFRFGEDSFREILFAGFEILRLNEVRDEHNDPGICCIGKKL